MRQLGALSDVEFERLASHLLEVETKNSYERFGVGPDGGIDLRYVDESSGTIEVVQCKHYVRSSFSQLEAAAKQEVPKLAAMEVSPSSYRFVTSQSLTVGQKKRLLMALDGWITDPALIWGAEKIEDLLDQHSEVERRHVKLWLSSSGHLEQLLNAGTLNRSNELIARITEALPRYVQTGRFDDALEMLREHGVCLIAGEPGIGKTTLAQMLLLECARQKFDALYVSEDAREAWDVVADRPQAFYYDDFLGRIGLAGLSKNEDQRLVDLIARAKRDPRRTRIILTTREYILRDAVELYDSFERAELDHKRFLLALTDYSRYERGLVLYNHLYHSEAMRREWLQQLVESKAYIEIVDHANYNPRLIEFITGHAKPRELQHIGNDWVSFALDSLNHPDTIWKRAFENELDDIQRAMLVCLVSMGVRVEVELFRDAVRSYCEASEVGFDHAAFEQSLRVLDLTFLSFGQRLEKPVIDVANPSVSDFVLDVISDQATSLRAVLDGAMVFAQPRQLWEVAESGPNPALSERLRGALHEESGRLADAFIRTIDSDEVGSRYFIIRNGRVATGDGREERLALVVEACGEAIATSEIRSEWLLGRLEELRESWESSAVDGLDAVALFRVLVEGPCAGLVGGLGSVLKEALEDGLSDVNEFEALDELWRVKSDLFDRGDRDQFIGSFGDYAEQVLLEADLSVEQITKLEHLAENFGVQLDEHEVSEAREQASKEDWEPEINEDDRPESGAADYEQTTEALHDLFGRLGTNGDGHNVKDD